MVVFGDSEGAVWFGTESGLSRLQNNEWTSFSESNGLLHNQVNCIHEDNNGNIWVGHNEAGISVFDGNVWTYFEDIGAADIISDPQGNILVADNGESVDSSFIFIFNGMTWNEFVKPDQLMSDLFYDSRGTLWILGQSGISYYDGDIVQQEEVISIWWGSNELICEDINSNLYIGTFEYVKKYDGKNWEEISTWAGVNVDRVIAIEEDVFGNMIFGSGQVNEENISISVLSEGKWDIPEYLNNLEGKEVNDILAVGDSVLWIASDGAVIHIRNDFQYEFSMTADVNIIFQDHENTIWAGTRDGLYQFTGSAWVKHDVQLTECNTIAEDHDGNLWLGGSEEIIKYDGVSVQKMADIETSDIMVDTDGNIWASYQSELGVVKFDGDKWIHYADTTQLLETDYESWTDFAIDCELQNNRVYDIFEDSRGNIWFATREGIDKLAKDLWFHYGISGGLVEDNVRKIFEDSKNQMWFGTRHGISKLIPFSENVLIESKNITCTGGNDGAIDIQPEFLNPPYSYSIDGGITFTEDSLYLDIIAGEYHVIVKDGNNKIAIDDYVLLEEPESDFDILISHVSCFGLEDGSIDLTVEGDGVSPITYQWSNDSISEDISGLEAGSYTVTISYDICEFTREITVNQPDTLVPSSIVFNNCKGSSQGGADLLITGGRTPYTYAWSDGSTEEDLNQVNSGVYYVDVLDKNGCMVSDTVNIMEIGEVFDISINTSYGEYYCESSTILNVPEGYESYTWMKGNTKFSNLSTIVPDGAGSYSVSVVNASNCRSQDEIRIYNSLTYQNEEICMVTVDPATEKNMIIWNRTSEKATNRYHIYRETDVTGDYQLIGETRFSDPGQFIDMDSEPDQQSYRYKLSLIDTCGTESSQSTHHSTIHLTRNLGIGLVVNLIWSKYEGFEVATYNIWKGSGPSNLMKIGSVSGNNFTYTDQSPNLGATYYSVEVVSENSCNPTQEKSAYSSSFSNIVSVNVSGINAYGHGNDLLVSPNPFNSTTIITLPENETGYLNLYLYDITGNIIFRANDIEGPTYELHRNGLKNGMYFIMLSGSNTYLKKIIIN